jgi:pSer/pThr/pTyr-binding forkhead associated (FHA) protein
MRVVLEVLSGPDAGRKTLLGAGQAVQVGRTEWADFSLTKDGHMSSVHFVLETDQLACYVRDLGSSNGTFLNGKPVLEKTLIRNGDEIRAGQTVFVIRTEGDVPERASAPGETETIVPSAAPLSPAASATKPSGTSVYYSVESCDSGLTLCRGTIEDIAPAQLAARISQEIPAFLIAHFAKLETPLPDELEAGEHALFDWLEPAAAANVSPVMLSQDEMADWPQWIEEGWGEDAVICVFSKQQREPLLQHLRAACRRKPHETVQQGAMVGYCWPSVLAPLLSHYTPQFVQQLLTGIDAVMVELPDFPETWQIYGRSGIAELLKKLGFVQEPSEQRASTDTEDHT